MGNLNWFPIIRAEWKCCTWHAVGLLVSDNVRDVWFESLWWSVTPKDKTLILRDDSHVNWRLWLWPSGQPLDQHFNRAVFPSVYRASGIFVSEAKSLSPDHLLSHFLCAGITLSKKEQETHLFYLRLSTTITGVNRYCRSCLSNCLMFLIYALLWIKASVKWLNETSKHSHWFLSFFFTIQTGITHLLF